MSKIKNVKMDITTKKNLEYLGLNLDEIPKSLTEAHDLKYRVSKYVDDKRYKQYKFINVNDIDILLSDSNSFSNLKEKYGNASPLYTYLEPSVEEEENYFIFLDMVKKMNIKEIEKVKKEQKSLARNIPFKVRYNGNYLWSIYYSKSANRYFMLVPTENSDTSTFFYLLKTKIENKKNEKIFVPITDMDYEGKIIKKSYINDIENYLWLFTKDYPSIYEVTDKNGDESLQIVGETEVYGKIKTIYKNVYNNEKEASKFYKLLKALFILQTELPHYFKFNTNIDEKGKILIYFENKKIEYNNLLDFISDQYIESVKLKEKSQNEIEELNNKLEKYRLESVQLENDYIAKEKQISTFLECKKSFFGKVKYYFKLGKNSKRKLKKDNKEEEVVEAQNFESHSNVKEKVRIEYRNYTLDELVESYKEVENLENHKKNIIMDINALKLKNKNLKKKIENATLYIDEINEHKKSIFEFWKYSNKDEVAALEEGEQEEINVTKLEKTFNYDDDFENFGQKVDKLQRTKFTDSELDSVFLTTTDIMNLINRTYKKQAESKEFIQKLRRLKNGKRLEDEDNDFDIFGKLSSDNTKEKTLKNKTHRETLRNKYRILNIKEDMKAVDLKKALIEVVKNLKKALKKNSLDEDLYVYKATSNEIDFNEMQLFSLNEERELDKYINNKDVIDDFYLYRIKLNKGTNFIGLSNIIYYNNKNMTLPVGMSVSDKILIDLPTLEIKKENQKCIRKINLSNTKDDFSKISIETIQVMEFTSKQKEKKKIASK